MATTRSCSPSSRDRSRWPLAALLTCFLGVLPAPAAAITAFGLSNANQIVTFDTNTPSTPLSVVAITGLQSGETALGIDVRPATGQVYLLGSSSRIYVIDPMTGAATAVGAAFTPALSGTAFGFDFNPTVDRIRVASDADQNLRLHPDTGAVVFTDGTLAYAAADPGFGINPNVVASAYTNNVRGAATTTLYGIDSNRDALVIQNPPNNGVLNTVGFLGLNAGDVTGFDIAGSNGVAWAAITSPGGGVSASNLFRIDLTTGAATFVGTIGANEPITGMTVVPTPGAAQYGSATPGCFGGPAITATGSPALGNSAFAVGCVNAHPNTLGRLIVSGRDQLPPFPFLGADLWVDPLFPGTIWLVAATDAAGASSQPLPIPNAPALRNARLFLQYAWADRCARGGVAASNALAVTIL